MQGSPVVSLSPSSPSFNSYSSSANLAEIAARVVEEFRQESNNNGLDSDIFNWEPEYNNCDEEDRRHQDQQDIIKNHHNEEEEEEEEEEDGEDEDEFEFAVVYNEKQDCPSVTADDIFFNGQIKPFYPLFDTSLLSNDTHDDHVMIRSRVRSPLGKLMSEERETDVSLSCSSSEADDLDSLQPGTYCVWTPKAAAKESPPGRCKKSNSTGSSKRWNKFRELLLRRSNSDGKDTFVFLTPPPSHNNNSKNNKKASNKAAEHHHRHVKNRSSAKEDDDNNKRSLLPYRQDLVNFFSNVNGFPKR